MVFYLFFIYEKIVNRIFSSNTDFSVLEEVVYFV